MKRFVPVLIAVLCSGSVYAKRLCGVERLARFDRLPELLEGTRALQVSSRDRLGGNDGDGYFGTHPCLYTDADGGKVLFDERKPGCLYRFWMTFTTTSMLTNHVKFYFDGELTPSVDITVEELFSGTNSPFLTPLVGDAAASCKGYYCYVPFEYEESLKVTLDWVPEGTGYNASPFYYNMTFHQFDSANGVQTWDGSESVTQIVETLSQLGVDPKSTNGNMWVSSTSNIASGATSDLLSLAGMGAIQSIKLEPSPASVSVLQNCHLLMNWDGGAAEVNVPLGSFFGSGTNEMEVSSLPLGMTTNGDYYCFFPMPFWESAEICISNNSGVIVDIPFEIQYTTNAYDPLLCGYFYAVYTNQLIGNDGRDVSFITTQGRGHFIGLSLYIVAFDFSGNNLDHLEGDERIYFDGSLSPSIYGTGAEDYFNCAWYFNNAPRLLPYHGCALQQFNSAPPNATQAYRFHLSDVLPFYSEFKFGMEHGRRNDTSGIYSSVAYFYKQTNDGWTQTAEFDVTNGAGVSYQTEGSVAVSGAWGGEEASLDLTINLSAPTEGDLVFNEILADATVDGDPNGDGETDRVQDEFVEIANASGVAVDLSGLMIAESWYQVYNPRHTFAEGSKLKAGEAIVVFGGGDVSNLSEENVQFLVVENADPGEEYGLALDDDGDTVYLYAADETTILASVSFGFASPDGSVPAATDESIVLSPDVTGSEYVAHSDASGSSMYSPGTYADGSGFPGVDGVFGE